MRLCLRLTPHQLKKGRSFFRKPQECSCCRRLIPQNGYGYLFAQPKVDAALDAGMLVSEKVCSSCGFKIKKTIRFLKGES